jgi:TolB protein
MVRWAALVLTALMAGCDADGTVNNGDGRTAFTLRVSLSSSGMECDAHVKQPHISGDGRRVAFTSASTNLHADDADLVVDVFVKDIVSGEVFLASRATGVSGAKGQADAFSPQLSFDGRRVAFYTDAALDPADTGVDADIYVRDLDTHETFLVSRADGPGGAQGNGRSIFGVLSPDGRYVAFSSLSGNLTADDANSYWDVFLRDLEAGSTELVSRASGASGAQNNGFAIVAGVSWGATRVAIRTDSSTFAPPVFNTQLYVRDRITLDTLLVSRADGPVGAPDSGGVFEGAMSADGRRVAFVTRTPLSSSDLDADGGDVYVRDLDTGTTVHASRAEGAEGEDANDGCGGLAISGDGRFVAFATSASNLALADLNASSDIYVRDLLLNRTLRASLRTFGGEVSAHAFLPSLSYDGKAVVFLSSGVRFVDHDGNSADDAFVRMRLW